MIKQVIDINGYWKVIVYYNISYDFFDVILRDIGSPVEEITDVLHNLLDGYAKAATITKFKNNISYVLFTIHDSKSDYISSIVHEAEHVKDAILYKYNIANKGEPPAYTIGYIVKRMYDVFVNIKLM